MMKLSYKLLTILFFITYSLNLFSQSTDSTEGELNKKYYPKFKPGFFPDSLFTDISLYQFESLFDYYNDYFNYRYRFDSNPLSKQEINFQKRLEAITMDEWIIIIKIFNTIGLSHYQELGKKKYSKFFMNIRINCLNAIKKKTPVALLFSGRGWLVVDYNIYFVGLPELSIRYRILNAQKLPTIIHD